MRTYILLPNAKTIDNRLEFTHNTVPGTADWGLYSLQTLYSSTQKSEMHRFSLHVIVEYVF